MTSTGRRITTPLRALLPGAAWLARSARRALKLAWWLGTGQFGCAADASIAFYRRSVPLRIKAMMPHRLVDAVKRQCAALGIALSGSADPAVKRAVAEANAAVAAQDWPEALSRWQALLDGCNDDEATAGHAKLNISVARRLAHVEAFREQVGEYAKACAARTRPPKGVARIAVYTAISRGYDSLKLPDRLDARLDYVLFTDTPTADTGVWRVRPMTYFHEDATRMARFVKTHPHMLLADYDIAVWIDANIMVLGDVHALVAGFLASGLAVAAVPHPQRKSIYEEVEASARKDVVRVMRDQIARYRGTAFTHDDLIESNLIMFDLRDRRARRFFDTWWREIDRHSKRDQLSLNYALKQAGIEWHRLTERPNSARSHPALAFVPHDRGGGPARRLIDALAAPMVDPYAGPSYADVREQRIAAGRQRRIDVVVCVHNALDDVRLCFDSILRTRRSGQQRLIVIDDGSDDPTARYLEEFCRDATWAKLHRNTRAQGYTRSANQGLAASSGELVILLNSDTIVTDGWAEKLADAVYSTAGAGIVGPMSNAASHQSIPEHRSSEGQTAINVLPPGVTAEDMNRYCEHWTTADVLPRVPLVHGFCFGVTREVLNEVALFDDASYPHGYSEENDYCFRATNAGFGLVVATHTYIFHAKSKSYAAPKRAALMKAGSQTLARAYGSARIHRAVRSMQENPIFVRLRQRAGNVTGRVVP